MATDPPEPLISDTELLSSSDEARETQPTRTGVPTCPKCRKPMMPRFRDGDWFWGCQDYPKCRGQTTKHPAVPERLRKAAEARFMPVNTESNPEINCGHPLTRVWGNATGRGLKCLLCGSELEAEKNPRIRLNSRMNRAEELEEAVEQIAQADADVRAVTTLIDEAMKAEEGVKKAMMRAAKTKLNTSVPTHLEVAQGLVRGPPREDKDSGSHSSGARPSRSD